MRHPRSVSHETNVVFDDVPENPVMFVAVYVPILNVKSSPGEARLLA
jgi:hypothetical protein